MRHELPPGPRAPRALQTAMWIVRPGAFFDWCRRRHGETFTLRLPGADAFVLVTAPADLKRVFTAPADVLHAGESNDLLRPVLGPRSILLLDEADHLRQRRLLLPPFHGERMHTYATVMRDVTEDALDRMPIGRSFSLHRELSAITLEVILRTVFGIDDDARRRPLAALLVELLEVTAAPIRMVPAFWRIDLFELLPRSRAARLKREIDATLYAEIARARRRPADASRTDVLSMMLAARDEEGRAMTDGEIRDELVTLLLAGHETTATALAWTVERTASEPRVLERIDRELVEVVGDGPLEPGHVAKLEYLDAVTKEALRARPVVPIIGRMVKKPFELGGYVLPPGVAILVHIVGTHTRADLYPEPEAFRPERFLGKKPDPYEWIPFGGGSRRCLGMAFALYEMKVVFATLRLRARFALDRPSPLDVARRGVTLAPEGGLAVRLERRMPRRSMAARANAA